MRGIKKVGNHCTSRWTVILLEGTVGRERVLRGVTFLSALAIGRHCRLVECVATTPSAAAVSAHRATRMLNTRLDSLGHGTGMVMWIARVAAIPTGPGSIPSHGACLPTEPHAC